MNIKFWGCRGSIPVPDSRMIKYGGNTSCIEVIINNRVLILDAGTGIRKLGEDLINKNIKDIDIFITHSHWDHIQGFPFFKSIYRDDYNINIFGCSHSYKQIKNILSQQMSYEFFPVKFSELKSKINFIEICKDEQGKCDHSTISKVIQANHPIFTLGVRIEDKGKSFVFITDNELRSKKPTTPWDGFVKFCSGADYLIHDAQFTDKEYDNRIGWGHSSFRQVLELANEAGVKNLGFYHHDPDRQDYELDGIEEHSRLLCKEKGYTFNIFTVKEQDTLDLDK